MRLRPGFYLRLALVADLGVYLTMIVLFVLLPLFPTRRGMTLESNELTAIETGIAVLVIVPAIGLFGRLVITPRVPYNEWAYLATGFYGLLVMAAFLTVGLSSVYVNKNLTLVLVMALLIGIIGSAGAHVFDGGREPLGPRLERFLRGDHGT